MGNYRTVPHFETDVYVVRARPATSGADTSETTPDDVELLITNTEHGWWTPKHRVSDGGQKHANHHPSNRGDNVNTATEEFIKQIPFIQKWTIHGSIGDRYAYEYYGSHFDNPPTHLSQPVLVTVSESNDPPDTDYKWIPLDDHNQRINHEKASENTNTISTLVPWHLNNTTHSL